LLNKLEDYAIAGWKADEIYELAARPMALLKLQQNMRLREAFKRVSQSANAAPQVGYFSSPHSHIRTHSGDFGNTNTTDWT